MEREHGQIIAIIGSHFPPGIIDSSGAQNRQYDDLEATPATVRPEDIVDALEMQFDESSSFWIWIRVK
jgi:hypothetical protein